MGTSLPASGSAERGSVYIYIYAFLHLCYLRYDQRKVREPVMSRLTIEVTEEQHQSIKALAALQGKSIKEYALERLFSATQGEDAALAELKTLLAARIAEGLRGKVSDKSIAQIAEDELTANGRE
jgi:Antitoxin ParD